MSPDDVPPDEMGSTPDHVDRELERLLSFGGAEEGPAELRSLLDDLTTAFPPRRLEAEDAHLAAMIDAAHLLAENGDPVARPVSNADAPAPQVSRLPKRRRNEVRDVKKTVLTKVIAPIAAVMLMSGMAFAGVLPTPLQDTIDGVFGTTEEPDDVLGTTESDEDDDDVAETDEPEDADDDDAAEDPEDADDDDVAGGNGNGNGNGGGNGNGNGGGNGSDDEDDDDATGGGSDDDDEADDQDDADDDDGQGSGGQGGGGSDDDDDDDDRGSGGGGGGSGGGAGGAGGSDDDDDEDDDD